MSYKDKAGKGIPKEVVDFAKMMEKEDLEKFKKLATKKEKRDYERYTQMIKDIDEEIKRLKDIRDSIIGLRRDIISKYNERVE